MLSELFRIVISCKIVDSLIYISFTKYSSFRTIFFYILTCYAPDPGGGAYDAPPGTLVARGFLHSFAASCLLRSQYDLLSRSSRGTTASRSQFFPSMLPLLNSCIRPPCMRFVELTNYGYFCIHCPPPNLCLWAISYFMNP